MERSTTAALASALIAIRNRRASRFGAALMTERWWDIVLRLYVADAQGEPLTSRELLDAIGCPVALGERWLRHLRGVGVILGDGQGRPDDAVTLAPTARHDVELVIDEARMHFGGA